MPVAQFEKLVHGRTLGGGMPNQALRRVIEAAILGPGEGGGVPREELERIVLVCAGVRARLGFDIAERLDAADVCLELGIRHRLGYGTSAGTEGCRAGVIVLGRDLLPYRRDLILLHAAAHRMFGLELFSWAAAFELLTPGTLLHPAGGDSRGVPSGLSELASRISNPVIPAKRESSVRFVLRLVTSKAL